jgi:hypothetical protein
LSDQPVAAAPAAQTWDVDAFLSKAQRYAETMLNTDRDDWRFALWSSLTLEHLLRAALAEFSPALLADTADWNNLFSALGYEPTAKKFIPKSIGTADVISRLTMILSKFDSEVSGFCKRHTSQRNAELHSGEIAFDGVKPSSWLPLFYKASKVLLTSVEKDLAFLFGEDEAKTADKLIAAHAMKQRRRFKGQFMLIRSCGRKGSKPSGINWPAKRSFGPRGREAIVSHVPPVLRTLWLQEIRFRRRKKQSRTI